MFHLGCLLLAAALASVSSEDCSPRDYGNGGTVCVCNKDHCDTVDPPTPAKGTYTVYTSNKAGLRMKREVGKLSDDVHTNKNTIEIGNKTYQSIFGFGGHFSDSTGFNILALDKEMQEKLLRSYFAEEGMEYSLCRVPIGCTDFSTRFYTHQDDVEDATLSAFKLQEEDYKYKISMIHRAVAYRKDIKLIASAWSSPTWMKVTGLKGGPFSFLKRKYYQSWADYHVKFLEEYRKHNVTFWGITTGNEPYMGMIPIPQPSVAWTVAKHRTWIKENLGPTIRNSSFSDIKLIVLDDQRIHLPKYLKGLFESKEVEDYVDGTGVHWYLDMLGGLDKLTKTHEAYPDKFILYTEASLGAVPLLEGVKLGSWKGAEDYASDIIDNMNHYVTGWIDWNMALDLKGGPSYIMNSLDASIIVNRTGGEFYKQPSFYAMGHFSKFVPPGSLRIENSSSDKKLMVTAFRRPDNGTAVIILNRHNNNKNVTILTQEKKKISLHVTVHSLTTVLYW